METRQGILYGVGVGPGDPELLTLKALRTLERCPVIAAPQTKSGGTLALEKSGRLAGAALVEDCGLPTERVCADLTGELEKTGYFAAVIVKER